MYSQRFSLGVSHLCQYMLHSHLNLPEVNPPGFTGFLTKNSTNDKYTWSTCCKVNDYNIFKFRSIFFNLDCEWRIIQRFFSFLVGNQIEVTGNVIFSNEEAADSGMNARDRLGESDTVNNVQC